MIACVGCVGCVGRVGRVGCVNRAVVSDIQNILEEVDVVVLLVDVVCLDECMSLCSLH